MSLGIHRVFAVSLPSRLQAGCSSVPLFLLPLLNYKVKLEEQFLPDVQACSQCDSPSFIWDEALKECYT